MRAACCSSQRLSFFMVTGHTSQSQLQHDAAGAVGGLTELLTLTSTDLSQSAGSFFSWRSCCRCSIRLVPPLLPQSFRARRADRRASAAAEGRRHVGEAKLGLTSSLVGYLNPSILLAVSASDRHFGVSSSSPTISLDPLIPLRDSIARPFSLHFLYTFLIQFRRRYAKTSPLVTSPSYSDLSPVRHRDCTGTDLNLL